jgi:hypothetical protein
LANSLLLFSYITIKFFPEEPKYLNRLFLSTPFVYFFFMFTIVVAKVESPVNFFNDNEKFNRYSATFFELSFLESWLIPPAVPLVIFFVLLFIRSVAIYTSNFRAMVMLNMLALVFLFLTVLEIHLKLNFLSEIEPNRSFYFLISVFLIDIIGFLTFYYKKNPDNPGSFFRL